MADQPTPPPAGAQQVASLSNQLLNSLSDCCDAHARGCNKGRHGAVRKANLFLIRQALTTYATQRAGEVREALRKYGRHLATCASIQCGRTHDAEFGEGHCACNCGLAAALQEPS